MSQRRTIITLVRHAQSFANAGIYHLKNCGLTRKGILQAKQIRLTKPIDLVYVSPLRRAQETLALSQLKSKRIITLPDLREYKNDVCDFMYGEMVVREPEEAFMARVAHVKQILRNDRNHGRRHIVLVGHADFFWEFTNMKLGHEHFNVALHNAESRTFDYDALLHMP